MNQAVHTGDSAYLIIWEMRVRHGSEAQFEQIYGADGPWVRLFRRAKGYLRTELCRDAEQPQRYLVTDYWTAPAAYQAFRERWNREYTLLDESCRSLTEHEAPLGSFLHVGHPRRETDAASHVAPKRRTPQR